MLVVSLPASAAPSEHRPNKRMEVTASVLPLMSAPAPLVTCSHPGAQRHSGTALRFTGQVLLASQGAHGVRVSELRLQHTAGVLSVPVGTSVLQRKPPSTLPHVVRHSEMTS